MSCSTHAELMVPLGLASQRRDVFSTGTLFRPVLGGVASMGACRREGWFALRLSEFLGKPRVSPIHAFTSCLLTILSAAAAMASCASRGVQPSHSQALLLLVFFA